MSREGQLRTFDRTDFARWLHGAHQAVICLGVFLYIGAIIPTATPDSAVSVSSDPTNTLLSATMLLSGLIVCLAQWRSCLRLLPTLWPFLLIFLLAMMSSLWSQAPAISFRRSGTLLGLELYAVAAYVMFGARRYMQLTVWTVLVLSVLGVPVAIVSPAAGMDVGDYANAVRGFFPQKNGFGIAMLDGLLALSFVMLDRGKLRWTDLLVIGVLLVILVLSRSTTSLLLSLIAVIATLGLLALERGGAWRMLAILAAIVAVVGGGILVTLVGVSGLFEIIGKDSTLTGRTEIWEAVWVSIHQRELLGYGYNGFWLPDTLEIQRIWAEVGWKVPAAHSGYLDLMLQFGEVGVALLILVTLASLWWSVVALFGSGQRRALWFLLQMGIHAILDRSESGLFTPDQRLAFWIIGALAVTAQWRMRRLSAVRPQAPIRPKPAIRRAVGMRSSVVRPHNS